MLDGRNDIVVWWTLELRHERDLLTERLPRSVPIQIWMQEYTLKVSDISRQVERAKTRLMLIAYLSFCLVWIIYLITSFVRQRLDPTDDFIRIGMYGFFIISVFWLPVIMYANWRRERQHRLGLARAARCLVVTMRYASQIKDHLALERLEGMMLEMHLREAEDALNQSARLLGRHDEFSEGEPRNAAVAKRAPER
jgi:hypothetical protein